MVNTTFMNINTFLAFWLIQKWSISKNYQLEAVATHCHCLGYVDDTALVAAGGSFNETHQMLGSMMLRPEGVNGWAVSHNSRFEASKSVLVDFSHAKHIEHPVMRPQGSPITPQPSHKFLGVIVDQELHWNGQHDHALVKASKWVLAFHCLAQPLSGANLQIMRQLYSVVAIPKMMYVADIWCTPIYKREGSSKRGGSVGITEKLASIQQLASMAITGAMCTTATNTLDLHMGLWLVHLMLRWVYYKAALRLTSLPKAHPLHTVFHKRAKWYIKTHRSPLHEICYVP